MAEYIKVARAEEIPEGGSKIVDVDGMQVALFKINGTIHALDNICPHRGGPLGEGIVSGTEVVCPWHAWAFNIETGGYVDDPTFAVIKFDVRVQDGDVEILIRQRS